MSAKRYVFDALYGPVNYPDYVWETLSCPEIQRLREVRLCNINSLGLSGGANVNRYEHSLGTAYLAMECLDSAAWGLADDTRRKVVLAALLHDVMSAAFGHSVQYVLHAIGYDHESLDAMVGTSQEATGDKYQYQHARLEQIYFGMPRRLNSVLTDGDLRAIGEIVSGRGPYGQLINGSIDLDNIDNVYRLAYHIGIVNSGKTPLQLARALRVEDNGVAIEDEALPLVEEWYEVRKRLYRYLLLNPEEFSAKCMLQEALEIALRDSPLSFPWHDVDYELLERLAKHSDAVLSIVSRLMLGDLYGCCGIYSTDRVECFDVLANPDTRRGVEKELGIYMRGVGETGLKKAMVGLHLIRDVNKTQRQVELKTTNGKRAQIGVPTHRVLIGVFFKNIHLSITRISQEDIGRQGVPSAVRQWLERKLEIAPLLEMVPYGEVAESE